jgi:hypothetical protein
MLVELSFNAGQNFNSNARMVSFMDGAHRVPAHEAASGWRFDQPTECPSLPLGVGVGTEKYTQLLTGRARMAGQVNKQEDRHVEGSKRK